MPDIPLFPEGWQTNLTAARQSAGAVGAQVAGVKDWSAENVRLYQAMVEASADAATSAKDFFLKLAKNLYEYAPNPAPQSWGDLYRYACAGADASISKEEEAWLSSLPGQALGAGAASAQDLRTVLTRAGVAADKIVDAGANVANSVAKAPGGGVALLLGGLALAAWALS